MRHVRLGRTGLRVSRLCLGTMTFGLQCDEPTSAAILDRAAAGGITFLDTSDVYPLGGGLETVGRTEEILGRWLGGRRQDFVIATKFFGAMSARPWDRGTSRKHVLDAIDGSLRRLRTDYVDLYQVHHPDPETPMDETLRAFDDVVRQGKARYWREREFATVEELRPLAAAAGMSMAQMAIAWVLAHPAITSPIIGASRPEQLDDVLAAEGKALDGGLKAKLDEMTLEYRFGDDPR